jgi:hypothetical protein
MDLNEIRRLLRDDRYEFSYHAQQERLEENLDVAEIEETIIERSEILEEYPDDPRGESCLLLGFVGIQPIHIVVGWARITREGQKTLRVITVYKPALPKWLDARTRRGRP